jgi:hypothetical protein
MSSERGPPSHQFASIHASPHTECPIRASVVSLCARLTSLQLPSADHTASSQRKAARAPARDPQALDPRVPPGVGHSGPQALPRRVLPAGACGGRVADVRVVRDGAGRVRLAGPGCVGGGRGSSNEQRGGGVAGGGALSPQETEAGTPPHSLRHRRASVRVCSLRVCSRTQRAAA